VAVALVGLLVVGPGCTKRQILPATIAGVGGGVMTAGFIYSATTPGGTGFFGSTTGDAAAIGGMVFGGIALAITGVLFAVTSTDCDSDADCWAGDTCLVESRTCVDRASLEAATPAVPTPSPAPAPSPDTATPTPRPTEN
jgi:hypothetical protein